MERFSQHQTSNGPRSTLKIATMRASVALLSGALLAGPAFAKGKPEIPGANGLAIAALAQENSGENSNSGKGKANGQNASSESEGDNDADDEAKDDDDENSENGEARGRTVVFSGFNGAIESHFRFANFGNHAAPATVVLHDAETGLDLGTWTSPAIPPHGALEVALADIAADATPAVDPLATSVVLEIRGGFNGHVQHLGFDTGVGQITDLTSCARLEVPKHDLGYVAGPGRSDVAGVIQVINTDDDEATAKLRLYGATTGGELGTWTSPAILGFSAIRVTVGDIVGAATPAIAEAPDALTIGVESPSSHVLVGYLEGINVGSISDFSAGCPLKGGGEDDDNSADEPEGEEPEDDDSGDDTSDDSGGKTTP